MATCSNCKTNNGKDCTVIRKNQILDDGISLCQACEEELRSKGDVVIEKSLFASALNLIGGVVIFVSLIGGVVLREGAGAIIVILAGIIASIPMFGIARIVEYLSQLRHIAVNGAFNISEKLDEIAKK